MSKVTKLLAKIQKLYGFQQVDLYDECKKLVAKHGDDLQALRLETQIGYPEQLTALLDAVYGSSAPDDLPYEDPEKEIPCLNSTVLELLLSSLPGPYSGFHTERFNRSPEHLNPKDTVNKIFGGTGFECSAANLNNQTNGRLSLVIDDQCVPSENVLSEIDAIIKSWPDCRNTSSEQAQKEETPLSNGMSLEEVLNVIDTFIDRHNKGAEQQTQEGLPRFESKSAALAFHKPEERDIDALIENMKNEMFAKIFPFPGCGCPTAEDPEKEDAFGLLIDSFRKQRELTDARNSNPFLGHLELLQQIINSSPIRMGLKGHPTSPNPAINNALEKGHAMADAMEQHQYLGQPIGLETRPVDWSDIKDTLPHFKSEPGEVDSPLVPNPLSELTIYTDKGWITVEELMNSMEPIYLNGTAIKLRSGK